ncbi:hypothetical protein C9J01_10260 [Photobacterium rosenbergii]|uniref:Uncharacterized protein n=1 Tax=Photobacterium rosenbergii TaxID=294936 RepID=A0A2T3NF89_9GAMM|nr:hypothetical protein [Photobacterium rosenbergii]PSW13229.1 hypothetical protein C9J01_10260 [Photobacterium rosenbergii]
MKKLLLALSIMASAPTLSAEITECKKGKIAASSGLPIHSFSLSGEAKICYWSVQKNPVSKAVKETKK